jgi:hypothetical protein
MVRCFSIPLPIHLALLKVSIEPDRPEYERDVWTDLKMAGEWGSHLDAGEYRIEKPLHGIFRRFTSWHSSSIGDDDDFSVANDKDYALRRAFLRTLKVPMTITSW